MWGHEFVKETYKRKENMEQEKNQERRLAYTLRMIHNKTKQVIHKSSPKFDKSPGTQLQGGILGFLYLHREEQIYQKDIEKEFRISRATATNTLQVMERNGFIVRKTLDKDARLKRIQMTEEAMWHHRQIEAHIDMMDRRMVQGMSREEVAELYRLLDIVMKNLEEMDEETGDMQSEEADCGGNAGERH